MNTTPEAPRLSASIPTAPVPANVSTNRAPSTDSPRISNNVSRSRSLVGRSASPFSVRSVRRRYFPPMTRILADRSEKIAVFPGRAETGVDGSQLFRAGRIVRQRKGFAARQFQQFAVTQRMGHRESQIAVLPSAEKFARSAQLQIFFGDFKAVRCGHQNFQAFARHFGNIGGRDKDTCAGVPCAANAAS